MISITDFLHILLYSVILSAAEGTPTSPMYREPKTYYVYIMGSQTGTLYIGVTSKLHARTFEHKSHRLEGFTDKYDVDRLLYWESFDRVHRAIGREKQLKGWRRSKKIALIESLNPHWLDLAREWFPSSPSLGDGRGASTPLSMTRMLRVAKRRGETVGAHADPPVSFLSAHLASDSTLHPVSS